MGKAGRFAYWDLLGDHATDLKRGCSGRRRRVTDMDCRRIFDYQEIIDQCSVRPQSLCPHTGWAGYKILFGDFGYQLLQAAYKSPFVKRPVNLLQPGSRVLRG